MVMYQALSFVLASVMFSKSTIQITMNPECNTTSIFIAYLDQVNNNSNFFSFKGGGAPLLTANKGKTKTACFKLKYPGFYFYHCAVDPVHVHVANGMYGVILVEPEEGLAPAKEFYVMQSEIYAQEEENTRQMSMSYDDLLNEKPKYVVLNGKSRVMVEKPLEATTTERVRIYFGNAGND